MIWELPPEVYIPCGSPLGASASIESALAVLEIGPDGLL